MIIATTGMVAGMARGARLAVLMFTLIVVSMHVFLQLGFELLIFRSRLGCWGFLISIGVYDWGLGLGFPDLNWVFFG